MRSLLLVTMIATMSILNTGCATTQASSSNPKNPDEILVGEEEANPKTLFGLARMYIAQNKEIQAERVLWTTIGSFPDFTPAYSELAQLQVNQGRTDEAVAVLTEAVKQVGGDPVIFNNLGVCQLLIGDLPHALERFQAASDLRPREARYVANKALTLGLMGQVEESEAIYRQLLTEDEVSYNMSLIAEMLPEDSLDVEMFNLLN